jgi:hypothetical protein
MRQLLNGAPLLAVPRRRDQIHERRQAADGILSQIDVVTFTQTLEGLSGTDAAGEPIKMAAKAPRSFGPGLNKVGNLIRFLTDAIRAILFQGKENTAAPDPSKWMIAPHPFIEVDSIAPDRQLRVLSAHHGNRTLTRSVTIKTTPSWCRSGQHVVVHRSRFSRLLSLLNRHLQSPT